MSLDLPHLPLDTGSKYHICAEFIQWESVGRISWGSHRLHDSDVIQVLDVLGFRFRMVRMVQMVRMVPMVRRAQVMLRWRPSQLCSLLWGKLSLLSTIDKLTCFSCFSSQSLIHKLYLRETKLAVVYLSIWRHFGIFQCCHRVML